MASREAGGLLSVHWTKRLAGPSTRGALGAGRRAAAVVESSEEKHPYA
jgi:hypothetical protein